MIEIALRKIDVWPMVAWMTDKGNGLQQQREPHKRRATSDERVDQATERLKKSSVQHGLIRAHLLNVIFLAQCGRKYVWEETQDCEIAKPLSASITRCTFKPSELWNIWVKYSLHLAVKGP